MGMKTAPGALELHIDELVLRGFPASHRFEISDAVERELIHLLTENGIANLAAGPANIDWLDAGSFRVPAGARPRAIGAQIGKAVFGGLTRR